MYNNVVDALNTFTQGVRRRKRPMNSIQQTILPFQLKETNDCITSRSGLAVYFEAAKCLKLSEKIKEIFPRPGSNRGHNAHDIIMSLIMMMLAGGQHMSDIREIAQDKGLLKLCGLKKVPSPDAVARFLKKPGSLRLLNFLIEYTNKQILLRSSSNNLTVDIDATLVESNKESALYTYEKFKGYSAMLSFNAADGLCLAGKFRDGNISPADGIPEHIKYIDRITKKLGKKFYKFRSDSAAYNHDIFDYCMKNDILFSVTADHDSAVMTAVKLIPGQYWAPFYDSSGVKTDREYASTVHTMNKSNNAFSLIALRWKNPQPSLFESEEYCYHIIATSDFNTDDMDIIHDHNRRGNAENHIKEVKGGLGLEHIPTNDTYSNAVYFAIGLLAYNLTIGFKDFLPEEFKKSTIATLRFYLISIPGKVVSHGRQLLLKLQKRFLEFIGDIRRSLAAGYLPV